MTTLCSPLQTIRTVSCFCLTHTNRLIGTLLFENSSLQQTCNGNNLNGVYGAGFIYENFYTLTVDVC